MLTSAGRHFTFVLFQVSKSLRSPAPCGPWAVVVAVVEVVVGSFVVGGLLELEASAVEVRPMGHRVPEGRLGALLSKGCTKSAGGGCSSSSRDET